MTQTTSLRHLAFLTSTRADFNYLAPIMREARRQRLRTTLIATGTHYWREYGMSYRDIEAQGFSIDYAIRFKRHSDEQQELPVNAGRLMQRLTPVLCESKADALVVLGDRPEILAGALAALALNKAIVHVHGGDVTSGGAADDSVRHALSKLAHLHYPANRDAAQRLQRMGEQTWRIRAVGDTSLDLLRDMTLPDVADLANALKVPWLREHASMAGAAFAVFLQHGEALHTREAARQARMGLAALKAAGLPVLAIAPNADAGGRAIREVLVRAAQKSSFVSVVENLPADYYYALLKHATLLYGNSSSGLIEAPALGLPVVNVGQRQAGRWREANVVDAPFEPDAIKRAIARALRPAFFQRVCREAKAFTRRKPASAALITHLKGIAGGERLFRKPLP